MRQPTTLLPALAVLLTLGCAPAEEPAGDDRSAAPMASDPVASAGPASDTPTTAEAEPGPPTTETSPDRDAYSMIDWDTLVPEDWRPDDILAEYDLDSLQDDDPRAKELMERLDAAMKAAPVVPGLNGRRVKIPGFVVPIETDSKRIGEFLLVPYYGACIHVPPPPANQTVHVVSRPGSEYEGGLFDTVWVSGTLKVEASSSDLADAGYRLDAVKVEPYDG